MAGIAPESPFMLAFRSRSHMGIPPLMPGGNRSGGGGFAGLGADDGIWGTLAQGGGLMGMIGRHILANREKDFVNTVMEQVHSNIANGMSAQQALHKVLSEQPDILAHPQALQLFEQYNNAIGGKDIGKLSAGEKYFGPPDQNGKATVLAENPDTATQTALAASGGDVLKARQLLITKDFAPKVQTIESNGMKVAGYFRPDPNNPEAPGTFVPLAKSPVWGPSDDEKNAQFVAPGMPNQQRALVAEWKQGRTMATQLTDLQTTRDQLKTQAEANPNDAQAAQRYKEADSLVQKFVTQSTNPIADAVAGVFKSAGGEQNGTAAPTPTPQPQQVPLQQQPAPMQGAQPQPQPQAPPQGSAPPQQQSQDTGGMTIDAATQNMIRQGLLKHRDIYEPAATQAQKSGQPVTYTNENGTQSTMTPQAGMAILQMLQQESQGEAQQ